MSFKQKVRTARALLYRSLLNARHSMLHPSYPPSVVHHVRGERDLHRAETLALALQRIETEGIPGHLAEVGVYRGQTSALLSRYARYRRLYLFDTFGGFPEGDLEAFQKGDARFRNTDLDLVRQRVDPHADVVFRVGRVPESLAGLEEERFAFVLLDLDLLAPTEASLAFFYPRLSTGGYLFVHDYNNPESQYACRRALDAFLKDKPEHVVEVADLWGSALIRRVVC